MMTTRPIRLALLYIVAVVGVTSSAQLRVRGRFAVTQAAAEKAIAEDLFHEPAVAPGVEVRLLSDAVASLPAAPLDVTGVKPMQQGTASSAHAVQLLVRFSCHVRSICVPFYGRVSLPFWVSLPTQLAAYGHVTSSAAPATTRSATARPDRPALQRGTHATLLLEDGQSQIALPVIVLADAALGESVRVASLDRRHVYVARTISSTELKGAF